MIGFGWEKNVHCKVTTTKNVHLWELPFLSVLIIAPVWYSTPSHASFWKNKPLVKCKDGWWKYFFAIPFLLPCVAMDAGCSEKGQCRGIKKQRGKQKTWWLTSAGGRSLTAALRQHGLLVFLAQTVGWWVLLLALAPCVKLSYFYSFGVPPVRQEKCVLVALVVS